MTEGRESRGLDPESLWRLVDGKSTQLKDAVWGARVPFLLSLLWAFVWFVALYNHDYGYTRQIVARLDRAAIHAREGHAYNGLIGTTLARYHLELLNDTLRSGQSTRAASDSVAAITASESLRAAARRDSFWAQEISIQHRRALEEQVGSWIVTLPGLPVPITVFDLGVIGALGLLIISIWFFFATRRENHAVRSFVDFKDEASKARWYPMRFVLEPQDQSLGTDHYSVAYHSVAHRFVFLFSRRSEPLLWTTICLMLFPVVVATWNCYTDVRDYLDFTTLVGPQALVRLLTEGVLLVGVLTFQLSAIRLSVQTSVVLNGWYLAGRFCWEQDWADGLKDAPGLVLIDREQQRAERFEAAARRGGPSGP